MEKTTMEPPDFYGETMRLQLSGFIRGEIKFPSFHELIAQITTDVQDTKDALDVEIYQTLQKDSFISDTAYSKWIGSGGGDEVASWEFENVETALERLTK
jgi:hypothetical protein